MTFREKTTFVIGAGASAEFGLPVGSQLATMIKRSTRKVARGGGDQTYSDKQAFQIVMNAVGRDEMHRAVNAVDAIHKSIHTAVSIDALVDRLDNSYVSKAAKALIAVLILRAERTSTLSSNMWEKFDSDPDRTIDLDGRVLRNPDNTWIGQFFRILTDNVKNPELIGREISIICFNYDRCIEFYLTKTISEAYQISRERALSIVERINIIHPYGSLGKLAIQGQDIQEDRIAFGPDDNFPVDYQDVAESIRTYTEQVTDIEQVAKIHEAMSCRVLVFLGFGFNNQNMNLLRVDSQRTTPSAVYVSAHGFHKQVEGTLVRRIAALYDLTPRHDLGQYAKAGLEFGATASDLFSIHTPNLSSFKRMRLDTSTGQFTSPTHE
jgi:hypothetical protein